MVDESVFSPLREPLSAARSLFLFLPREPGLDQVAASLGLYLSLRKANKAASLACPTQMKVEHSRLVGVDQVRGEVGGKNLVVSLDYLKDSIDKVSYNIEGNRFNLVVQPKEGFPPLSAEKVSYSYAGGEADLIITIGVRSLDNLGNLYQQPFAGFDRNKIVDVDLSPKKERIGQTELVLAASSFSEIIARLIKALGFPIDIDIAANLLLGIRETSGNFSSPTVTAATFEAAAFCLRNTPSPAGERYRPAPDRSGAKKWPLEPMPENVSAVKKPEEPAKMKSQDQAQPSSDWFEPKVYQGSTKI